MPRYVATGSAGVLFVLFFLVIVGRNDSAAVNKDQATKAEILQMSPYQQETAQQNSEPTAIVLPEIITAPPNVPRTTATTTTTTSTTLPPTTTTTVSQASDGPECPSLSGNMDTLTQNQFVSILTHECRYDKSVRPEVNHALNAYLQIDLKHIEAVDQLQFKTHMLMQYRFMDQRLAYDIISPERKTIVGEETLREKIWIPHVVLWNDRDTAIMGLEGKDIFVAINPKGEVLYSYRMTATIYCWMNLKKFPFDTQTCDMQFKSWTYNASYLSLHWENNQPVKIAKQLHLTEFTLKTSWTYNKYLPATLSHSAFIGNYSSLVFTFQLDREVGYYIMDYFIPSIMLVCTSWVTFWLHADASAPRVTLGTSTMLTFITLSSGQAKNLPKVSYIKASEIWFLGITVFLFASMAEFAFVNIIYRRKKKVELKKKSSKYILKSTLTPRLARKQLERSISAMHKSHSCSSLDLNSRTASNGSQYNNYLTVHSFPSSNVPTITTQSADDLVPNFRGSQESISSMPIPERPPPPIQTHLQSWTTMTPQEVAIWIDKRSRIVFPCAFLIFNIFYWSFVYACLCACKGISHVLEIFYYQIIST